MIGRFILLFVPVVFAYVDNEHSTKGMVKMNEDGSFKFTEIMNMSEADPDHIARGEYRNAINQTGWGFLEVATNPDVFVSDGLQAIGAGYFEGYITSELLYMYYQNTIVGRCDGKKKLCKTIDKWINASLDWMREKIKFHGDNSPYWHQVSLFLSQLTGIQLGYSHAMKGKGKRILTTSDILTMNIFGDLEDLESALGDQDQLPNKVKGMGHCSALIRLLPLNSDLLVSHDTWNSYQSMLRLVKKYSLPYKKSLRSSSTVPGHTMSFSGYPGVIYSGDDFTIASSGLTILETTIGNSNRDLWKHLKPQSVLEGIRSTVANRLATDGRSWTKWFSKHNSGTYNNQWMVVDYNKFNPGEPKLQKDLLWILEQIPGYIQLGDMTKVLEEQNYWPSYNTPYFKDVFNMSGDFNLMKQYGDWFSYENTPRAKIFKRDAPKVNDIASMIKLMRYNDYTKDPLSGCDCSPPYSAENAISARNDLNPRNGTYPFPALSHRSHGGTDMKLTSFYLAREYKMVAQGGPTWDSLPPFRWSEQDFKDTPHVGQPDLWQFKPLVVTWKL